jgi:hypothetical protein
MIEVTGQPTGGGSTTSPGEVSAEAVTAMREELRRRPEHLRVATAGLAAALEHATEGEQAWLARARTALAAAMEEVRAHNEEAEGPDGLLTQVVADAPWLSPRVHAVEQEHDHLLAAGEALLGRWDDVAVPEARRELAETARRIEEHRHHGTELLMDAYGLDISAGD